MSTQRSLKSTFKDDTIDPSDVLESFEVVATAIERVRHELTGKNVRFQLLQITPPAHPKLGSPPTRPTSLLVEETELSGAEGLIHALTDLYLNPEQDPRYVKRYLGLARVPDACIDAIQSLSDAKNELEVTIDRVFPIKGKGAAVKMARQRWMKKHLKAHFDNTVDQRMLKRVPLILKYPPQTLVAYWQTNPITHEKVDQERLDQLIDDLPCPAGTTLDELEDIKIKARSKAYAELRRGRVLIQRFVSNTASPMVYFREEDERLMDPRHTSRPYVLPIVIAESACSDSDFVRYESRLDLKDLLDMKPGTDYTPRRTVSVVSRTPIGILNLESMEAPKKK